MTLEKLSDKFEKDIVIIRHHNQGDCLDVEGTGLKQRYLKLKAKSNVFSLKHLAISGNDIMEEVALPQGKTIGNLLKHCFEMVVENPMLNNKDILLQQCNYLLFKGKF